METNDFMNPKATSYAVMLGIMGRSDYHKRLCKIALDLRERILQERDEATLLQLNMEMATVTNHLAKLHEYAPDIHFLFRHIPVRSARLDQAETHFYRGEFEEMDNVLDADQIRKEAHPIPKNAVTRTTPRRMALAYELLIKGYYYYTCVDLPDFSSIGYKFFRDAYLICCDTHTTHGMISHLKLTNEADLTIGMIDQVEDWADDLDLDVYLHYLAKGQYAKGFVHGHMGNKPMSNEWYSKALATYTELSEINFDEYLPVVGEILMILGLNSIDDQNFKVALVQYEEAERIRRRLAVTGDFDATIRLADTLGKLCVVHIALKEYPEAQEYYGETIALLDSIMEVNIYDVLQQKSEIVSNFVAYYMTAGDFESALRQAKETLEIYQKLQEISPFGQLLNIIEAHEMLATIYQELKRPEDSLREREKIFKLYKILYQQEPSVDLLEALTEAINLRTNEYGALNKNAKYRASLLEALDYNRKLAVEKPVCRLAVACNLANLAYSYEKEGGRRKEMLEAAQESYDILSSLEREEMGEKLYQHLKKKLNIND
jgi:tetratricopeptide (TPR) repeat protein